jgi:hypothetical protein
MDEPPPSLKRHQPESPERPITIREDAPGWLRDTVIRIAYLAGLQPSELREVVCDLVLTAPDYSNTIEYPGMYSELSIKIRFAEWFQFYDFVEIIYRLLQKGADGMPSGSGQEMRRWSPEEFARKLNDEFRRSGIGWQLVDGRIELRGGELVVPPVDPLVELFRRRESNEAAAERELGEALDDLSKSPDPNIAGAIQHAMVALEAMAPCAPENFKPTLAVFVTKDPGSFSIPTAEMMRRLFIFATVQSAQFREGRTPGAVEAELFVGAVGTLVSYVVGNCAL